MAVEESYDRGVSEAAELRGRLGASNSELESAGRALAETEARLRERGVDIEKAQVELGEALARCERLETAEKLLTSRSEASASEVKMLRCELNPRP
jgi:chromosome segregation ATPase